MVRKGDGGCLWWSLPLVRDIVSVDSDVLVQIVATRESPGAWVDRASERCNNEPRREVDGFHISISSPNTSACPVIESLFSQNFGPYVFLEYGQSGYDASGAPGV